MRREDKIASVLVHKQGQIEAHICREEAESKLTNCLVWLRCSVCCIEYRLLADDFYRMLALIVSLVAL